MSIQSRDSLLIFLIGVAVFTIGLEPEFLGLDTRFGMFAQEMFRNGPTFFPTTYGEPYPDYPASSTFLIYLSSLPFGKVTTFSAVIPMAITCALILAITYRIGAIHSRMWGLFAVALALFTKEFFSLSRSLSPDQYVTLATVLIFYIVYSADYYNRQKRLWFIPVILASSFAFRGPIGLVIPAAVLCGYYIFNKNYKTFALMTVVSAVVLAVCAIGLLEAAKYQGGDDFVKKVIALQAADRIGRSQHGFAYYWVQSFGKYAIVYPFAILVVIARFKSILKRKNQDFNLIFNLCVWIIIIMLGMSIPGAKKIRYIVPIVPAAALIASYMFIELGRNDVLAVVKKIFLGFCLWFPLGTAAFIIVAWIMKGRFEFLSGINYFAVLIAALMLSMAGLIFNTRLKSQMHSFALMTVGAAAFFLILVGIEEPLSFLRDRTGPFVQEVVSLQHHRAGNIIFYKIGKDGDAIKFMVNLDKPVIPEFINSPEEIFACKEPAYFIAMKKDFDELPPDVSKKLKIADGGTISHDKAVVFTLTD